MKKLLLLLLLYSCKKNSTDPNVGTTSSISYKVNGQPITMDNGNILNEGVIITKQLKSTFLPNTQYLLNARKGSDNVMFFTIVTDSLHLHHYHYDIAFANASTGVNYSMAFNSIVSDLYYEGDYFDINITSYNDSKVSGTFTAKLTTISNVLDYSKRGNTIITEGKLNNVPVFY